MQQEIEQYEYRRKLGAPRPNFEGKPPSYYELKCSQITCAVSICFLIVIVFFWVCVAFFFWSDRVSTESIVTTWSIVLVVFIPIFIGLTFYCSYNKLEVEQNLIKAALAKQIKKKGNQTQIQEVEINLQHSHEEIIKDHLS